jgi:hypothetical protein
MEQSPTSLATYQLYKQPSAQSINQGNISKQYILRQIYEFAHRLREEGNRISAIWVPSQGEITLKTRAKKAAKQATAAERAGSRKLGSKSTILGVTLQKSRENRELPKGIGKYTTGMDRALAGKHTKLLYDSFKRTEAGILAQLCTGMARSNEYLHRVGASELDQCACG